MQNNETPDLNSEGARSSGSLPPFFPLGEEFEAKVLIHSFLWRRGAKAGNAYWATVETLEIDNEDASETGQIHTILLKYGASNVIQANYQEATLRQFVAAMYQGNAQRADYDANKDLHRALKHDFSAEKVGIIVSATLSEPNEEGRQFTNLAFRSL